MKKQLFEAMIEEGLVNVTVLPDRGADLPQDQWKQFPGGVPLNLSWDFNVPIAIDDHGFTTVLSFNGENHHVYAPWRSIVSMKSEVEFHMWAPEPEDVHVDVVVTAEDEGKNKPTLKLVT